MMQIAGIAISLFGIMLASGNLQGKPHDRHSRRPAEG